MISVASMLPFNHLTVAQYVSDMTGKSFEECIATRGMDVFLTTTDTADLKAFEESDPAMFVDTIEELIRVVNETKELLHSPVISDALEYSYRRAQIDGRAKKDKRTDVTNILFRKEELIAWLKRLWIKGFNPLVQLNNPKARYVKSVLRFPRQSYKKYTWIQPQYDSISGHHIKYYIIDTSQATAWELERLASHLYIWDNVKIYHPIVWKYIIDWDTDALLFNNEKYDGENQQGDIPQGI